MACTIKCVCHLCYMWRIDYLCDMKRIVGINRVGKMSLVIAMLLVMMAGCRRYPGDEVAVGSALAKADSLRYDAPSATDSIVRSLNADSLGSRANVALYSVLANEVNIYGDQVVVADSVVDIAVDYYRLRRWFSERNRHLYARALMQKATTLNQLYSNELAIRTLSDAEKALSDNDYELLGDVCLLKGKMYADNNSKLHEYIAFYHNAYNNYSLSSNIAKGAEMLSVIGAAYRTHNLDSSLFYLNKSDSIAREHNLEGLQIKNLAFLSSTYKINKDYRKAITTALNAISSEEFQTEELKETYYVICDSYLKLGMVDSALYYLEKGNFDTIQPKENLTRIIILRKASRISGDYKTAYELSGKEQSQIIQILNDSREKNISTYERKYRIEKLEWKNAMMTVYIVGGTILSILLMTVLIYYNKRKKEKLVDLAIFIENLNKDITKLKENNNYKHLELTDLKEKLSDYEKLIIANTSSKENTQFSIQTKLLLDQYIATINSIKSIERFENYLHSNSNKINAKVKKFISELNIDDSFWIILRHNINAQYNNVIDRIFLAYPSLNEQDLNLMAMIIGGYSNEIISFCFCLDGINSLYNKKNRLKNKMGLSTSLSKFLEEQIMS